MKFGIATRKKIDEVTDACRRDGGNSIVLLSGVAGTGKTFVALAAAQKHAGHPLFVRQVQFHQSYTYEDFIEGFRPTKEGGFAVEAGVFTDWNARALADPKNSYVLLIEEFTRANIAAVLGELMTFIEYRGRAFQTPVSRRRLSVAPNLVLVGTMNPRDRSALELDEALIRRLRIIDCPPDVRQLEDMLKGKMDPGLIAKVARLFTEIQKRHAKTYSTYMPFGHGIFAGSETEDDLRRLWHQRIRHLLYRPSAPAHLYAKDITDLYPVAVSEGPKAAPPSAAAAPAAKPAAGPPPAATPDAEQA